MSNLNPSKPNPYLLLAVIVCAAGMVGCWISPGFGQPFPMAIVECETNCEPWLDHYGVPPVLRFSSSMAPNQMMKIETTTNLTDWERFAQLVNGVSWYQQPSNGYAFYRGQMFQRHSAQFVTHDSNVLYGVQVRSNGVWVGMASGSNSPIVFWQFDTAPVRIVTSRGTLESNPSNIVQVTNATTRTMLAVTK